MKVIILAAGYGTRLYPLTLNKPKALLEIAKKPILNYLIEKVEVIQEVDCIYIVTNHKFAGCFQTWKNDLKNTKQVVIINDGTQTNEERLGAIGDILLVLNQESLLDDILIIGADNLFEEGIDEFIKWASEKSPAVSIGLHNLYYKGLASQYGIVKIDKNNKVLEFLEKPKNPSSTLVSMCLYYFPRQIIDLFTEYKNSRDYNGDNSGSYIRWLCKKIEVFGFIFEKPWYDIGSRESYEHVNEVYSAKDRVR